MFRFYHANNHWIGLSSNKQDFSLSMLDELIKISRANPNGFNVLNHGDAWCNNLLFQYNADNTIATLVPVDYQMCVWASPSLDLLYFIFTSVRGDIRLPELDNLINFYHRNLTDNLNLLEYSKPIPSLKELHLDFIDHIAYGFAACFGVLPICLMEKTENASIDTMMSADDAGRLFREKMFSTPEYVRQMTELLPFFCEYGAFDIRHSGYQTPSGVCSDYLNLPGWFRREFFNDVVEKKLHLRNGNYYITKLEVSIATSKGDNYGSVMYRCKINVENKANNSGESFSVIVKTRPTGMAAEFSDALNPFAKEIEMYEKLIPAFEALYLDKDAGVEIGPRCLKTCETVPSDVIVMEDLRSVRYKPVKRQDGLDQEHTERILEKLAQFHAASAVYGVRNGGFPEVFAHGLYNEKNMATMEHMFTPAYNACLEELRQNASTKEYLEDLEKLHAVAFSRTMDCLVVDPDGFNVLNHGDFWINNIMFQYGSDGRLEDAAIVDFQMCFYGSPVLDLNYFLFTSVKGNIKLAKLNHFIRYYHEQLVSNLTLLGYSKPLPTLKKLQMDFYDRIVYGAATMFGVNSLCHVEPTGDLDMEAMFMDNETGRRCRKEMYGNERYLRSMEQLLPFFKRKGAFAVDASVCAVTKKTV
ncbi:CHKov1 [Culex quinquefasciatus]|uniref:CHKov1 n=1 Tax=Culex quinquefasciatus TaxID=7176 RepID=B0X2N5_CULQU|nr:CHKov1 [Culex quinquefasciatus]|eukprot:XP_001863907.1 CHKov1 [Culex quinquefasciatus]